MPADSAHSSRTSAKPHSTSSDPSPALSKSRNPDPIPPNYTADWQRSKHLMILYGLGCASDEDNEDLDTEDEDLFSDMEDEDEDGDEDGEDMDEEENN